MEQTSLRSRAVMGSTSKTQWFDQNPRYQHFYAIGLYKQYKYCKKMNIVAISAHSTPYDPFSFPIPLPPNLPAKCPSELSLNLKSYINWNFADKIQLGRISWIIIPGLTHKQFLRSSVCCLLLNFAMTGRYILSLLIPY